jgi:hypothetical protein
MTSYTPITIYISYVQARTGFAQLTLYNLNIEYDISFNGQEIKDFYCTISLHLPPFSIEFTNHWSYTSTPPTCLHNVERAKFTFTYYVLNGFKAH